MAMAGISGAEDCDRLVMGSEPSLGPSAGVAAGEKPVRDSVDSVEVNVADVPGIASVRADAPPVTPAEPVVMNTGSFGTVTPGLSATIGRAPNSARALDSERTARALFAKVLGAGGGVTDSD
jgi:hypothetical protein